MTQAPVSRVIAVDPGGLSGLAIYDLDVRAGHGGQLRDALELPPEELWDRVEHALRGAVSLSKKSLITYERFTIDQRTVRLSRGGSHDALDVIGGLRFLAHRYHADYEAQGVADAKNLVPNERLKALGFWRPTDGGHVNDALRHLLYRLVMLGAIQLPVLDDDA